MSERNKWFEFAMGTLFLFFPTVFYSLYYLTDARTPGWSARITNGLMYGLFFQVSFAIAALVLSALAVQLMKQIFKEQEGDKLAIDIAGTSLIYINASCVVAMVCVQRRLPLF